MWKKLTFESKWANSRFLKVLLVSVVCLKQMGAGKFSRNTSNIIQELLKSFDFSFINKSEGRDIEPLTLPYEHTDRTSKSLRCFSLLCRKQIAGLTENFYISIYKWCRSL